MLIFYRQLHKDVRLSPNIFKAYVNDMIVAIEAAKQGVTMGEDTVSGLMFADDYQNHPKDCRNR